MKTFKDITHLNYQQLAFFKSISIIDAKFEVAAALKIKELNKKGIPKVKANDLAPTNRIDFTMKANSALDGQSRLKYLVDYYNKGIDTNLLRHYGENTAFIQKIKFNGKYQIVADILNPEQHRKLQQIWLYSNCYNKKKFSKEAKSFINNNPWAADYLESRGIKEQEETIPA